MLLLLPLYWLMTMMMPMLLLLSSKSRGGGKEGKATEEIGRRHDREQYLENAQQSVERPAECNEMPTVADENILTWSH